MQQTQHVTHFSYAPPSPRMTPILALRAVAAACAALTAAASSASAGVTSKRLVNVHVDPGNFVSCATTVDASGEPSFAFSSGNIAPASASVYDSSGKQRWAFFNTSKDTKEYQVAAARHCESGGEGAGPVDVWVTENDVFNNAGFSVFGLSSSAASATPVWTLRFPDTNPDDGGFSVVASDRGDRIVVQYLRQLTPSDGVAVAVGVNGQTGAVEWTYNTTNPDSSYCVKASISANGAWVLFVDCEGPDSLNNATVLVGATGEVRDSSVRLPYYFPASAISDSGDYIAVIDDIAVNVYAWNSTRGAYELAYVLAPPPGVAVNEVIDVVMSTGPDNDESIAAMYSNDEPFTIVVGIWSLVDAALQTSWSRVGARTDGGLSADGAYVAAALEDGVVLLKRGANDPVFNFSADLMFDVSVNVVRAPGGASDTVYLAAAGGNNDAGGKGNTGDAYGYEIDVPDTVARAHAGAADAAAAAAAAAPCMGTFNGQPLEAVCFATLLNSSTTKGLSVRAYAPAAAAATTLVSYNVSALFPSSPFDDALTLAGFGVIEYLLGGFNQPHENLLDARTVPFLLLPPGAPGGWVGRMALAPSKFPARAMAPAPLSNVSLVALSAQPLTLAVLRESTTGEQPPTGAQLAALCARTVSAVAAGALPGFGVDAASPFATGAFALYYGRRDAPSGGPYDAECWVGVVKK
jgi:hypothetical protein